MDERASPPVFTFDGMAPDRTFTPSQMVIDAATVRAYGLAVGNPALVHCGDAEIGTPLPDLSLAVLFAIPRRVLARDGSMPPGGVLARQDIVLRRYLRLGEAIKTTVRVAARYEKRGRRYVHLRCALDGDKADPIGYVDNHIMWAG